MTNSAEKQKISLEPIGYRVLAKRTEEQESMKGKIILPESAKKKQETLEVIAIGQPQIVDGKEIPFPVKPKDRFLINKYAGDEITINDEEYVVVKADEIIAIVR